MSEETDKTSLANRYQHSAATCIQRRDYGSALALYLRLVGVAPERKSLVHDDAALAVREWGATLESLGRVEDALACYSEACRMFPESETIVNNLGAQLFRLGYMDEAACYFRRALQLKPAFLEARENLENVCCHLVERWHFRMLNDRRRNQLYCDAVWDAVRKDRCTDVLDIGAGTGLLSMFAVQAGAESVVACEMTKTMYELATDVLSANEMTQRVHLVHKSSMDLLVPQDLPKKASLLVTEIFDAGLIGEQTLPTIHHAWQNLLHTDTEKMAVIIPCGATVFISAIESESIRKQNRFLYPGVPHVDLTLVDLVSNTGGSSPPPGVRDPADEWEPYTSERLNDLAGGYHLLSEPTAELSFDFCNPLRVSEYMAGFKRTLMLSVTRDGRLDAIAMWFELQLDGSRVLRSSPESGSCWEQAIYPVLPSHLSSYDSVADNLYVRSGDLLEVMCSCTSDALHCHCTQITRKRPVPTTRDPQQQITDDSSSLDSATGRLQGVHIEISAEAKGGSPRGEVGASDGLPVMLPQVDVKAESVSGSLVNISHADHQSGSCENVLHKNCAPSSESHKVVNKASLLPSNPLPVVSEAVTKAKRSQTCSTEKSSVRPTRFSLTSRELVRLNDLHLYRSYASALRYVLTSPTSASKQHLLVLPSDSPSLVAVQALRLGAGSVRAIEPCSMNRRFLQHVAATNHVRLRCSDSEDFITLSDHRRKWHVLLCEPIDVCGCLRQRCLEDIALARVTCLQPAGLVIPDTITVFAMAIESDSLRMDSMVLGDDSTLGLKVAALMNIFKMTTHVDIELSTLRHTSLTTTFELFSLNLNEPLPGNDSVANFLSNHRCINVKVTRSGQVTAVVYWFEMRLVPGVSVNTMDTRTHWRQAAILLAAPLAVQAGDVLTVDAICRGSCIGIEVSLNNSNG